MHEDLALLASELTTVLGGLNAGECQLTPTLQPQKWSIQQVVEHLLLTYRSTVQVLQVRIEKRRPTQARASLRQRLGHFSLLTLGYFPEGRSAPPHVTPSKAASPLSGSALITHINEALLELDRSTMQAEEMFGRAACASHAVLGPLSIPQWTRFHLVHGRHHIKQIRRIRQDHVV